MKLLNESSVEKMIYNVLLYNENVFFNYIFLITWYKRFHLFFKENNKKIIHILFDLLIYILHMLHRQNFMLSLYHIL